MIVISDQRRTYFIVSFFLLVAVISGIVYYSTDKPLKTTHEVSATGSDPMSSTGQASSPVKKNASQLPYSFEVGRVNSLTVHSPRLYSSVRQGEVLMFGYRSSEPVDLIMTYGEGPEWGFSVESDWDSEILVNISESYCFFDTLRAPRSGVITFSFQAEPDVLARVALIGISRSPFKRAKELDNKAVGIARVFLELNDIEAGKYLDHTVEHGAPNYYWHKITGIQYPLMPEPCDYTSVRFEQKDRPGHFMEVWVNPNSLQVIGGDVCR